MVTAAGLLISVGTSFLVYCVLALLFAWFSRSPKNFVIYYPAWILKGRKLPEDVESRGIFAWIKEAWRASEENIVEFAGLDAAVYIRFLKTALQISLFAAFFGIIILVPICLSDHQYEEYNKAQRDPNQWISYGAFDLLGMGNISKESNKLWAFAVAAYWLSFGVYFFLYRSSAKITTMCALYQGPIPKGRVEQYSVLVRDIPKPQEGQSRAEQVEAFFRPLYGDAFLGCQLVYKLHKVMGPWKELERCRRKLKHAEALLAAPPKEGEVEPRRPQHKAGFLGLWGKEVDSIGWYEMRIKELLLTLEERQRGVLDDEATDAAFVFFSSREVAHLAAQAVHARQADTWQVSPAPDPPAVLWHNLSVPVYQRTVMRIFVWAASFVIVCLFLIVVAFVSALTTLSNLEKMFDFLVPILEYGPVKSVVEAYLPQLVLIGALYLMPYAFLQLVRLEGIESASREERAASGQYYTFLVVNVFIGVTIAGTVLGTLKELVHEPTRVTALLGSSLPPNASFFITYVALRFFVGYGLELSRLTSWWMYTFERKYFGVRDEEQYAWHPGSIHYYSNVPQDLLILTLGLCYAVISPMILPFVALYFFFGWLVYRNQVLKVYIRRSESGGRMWPHMNLRFLAALLLAQLTLVGYFTIQRFQYKFVLVVLPFLTLIYGWIWNLRFGPSFKFPPLEVIHDKPKREPTLEELALAYTAPCMRLENRYHHLGVAEPHDYDFLGEAGSDGYTSLPQEDVSYAALVENGESSTAYRGRRN